ncbi:MAG: ATP-binding protein [Verrucomicrobiales bacterium]|nr:ATP-binding protein [Verrucomicrobiales bacterium]
MNRPIPISETLAAVVDVRRSLLDLVARHAAASQEGRQRRAAEEARHSAGTSAEARRLAEDLEQVRLEAEAAASRLEDRHRTRGGRIREAERRVRKAGLERAEAEEGRTKFALQRDLLKAARDRDAGLAAADAALSEAQGRLSDFGNQIDALEVTATATFHLGRNGTRSLAPPSPGPTPTTENRTLVEWMEDLSSSITAVAEGLAQHRRGGLTGLLRLWPVWLIVVLVPLPLVPVLELAGVGGFSYVDGAWTSGFALVVGVALYLIGSRRSRPVAVRTAQGLARARLLHAAASQEAVAAHGRERDRILAAHAAIAEQGEAAWQSAVELATWARTELPVEAGARARAALERSARLRAAASERVAARQAAQSEDAMVSNQGRLAEAERRHRERLVEIQQQEAASFRTFQEEWTAQVERLKSILRASQEEDGAAFARSWSDSGWDSWSPPASFLQAARFGWLQVDPTRMAEVKADHPLAGPAGSGPMDLPLMLQFPESGSIVFESRDSGSREEAIAALNQIVLRLLASAPPGRIAFTVLDPVGLGQGFAGLMHLADEAEHLISGRVWTQSAQIEARLADLNDHIEKVIQMYLRNEYADIAEYNAQAGDVAERYHFLVIADFPSGFTDLAAKRLASIATAGPRCGVHLLVHWDQKQPLPNEFPAELLKSRDVRVAWSGKMMSVNGYSIPGTNARLELPPPADMVTAFIQRVARLSIHSNRIEVPFAYVAPREGEHWSSSTASEVRVAIGRTRATRQQYLALGRGTRQHGLVAGKTGSGKSTLLHVIITNLALWCRPDEVEFYLVDFKKGVEFKCYASHRLPHARVVAIESDREFGLSVLQRVDAELRQRGEVFRQAGVQDVAGFREVRPGVPMPRVLLIIDEFQEFFVEEDRVAQNASLLLDRIVRQGRAFGVHVILGSQTLGGAYTVARSTMGQMAVRIALQCNEADAYLIMDETNAAPRLLSRPGEGIYNDAAGAKEGNSPFQVVWLPDSVRDGVLQQVRQWAEADSKPWEGPLVFEGNAPADLSENPVLRQLVESESRPTSGPLRLWLGAPNAIKGPTEVAFTGRSGDHVLLVGQRTDALEAFRLAVLVAMAAQNGADRFRCILLRPRVSDVQETTTAIGHGLPLQWETAGPGELDAVLTGLSEDLQSRLADGARGARPVTVLFIDGIQNFKKLRQDDEFAFGGEDAGVSAGARLKELVMEGAPMGIHVVATCDTYGNVLRYIGRKALAEFGFRILYQMSANDSASLMDGPEASRLGGFRALLHDEREGVHEVFRPYAEPSADWVSRTVQGLADRAPAGSAARL